MNWRCIAMTKSRGVEGKQEKIDLRMNNSRPKIGTTRRMAITAPDEVWSMIDELIEGGTVKTQAEAIRMILFEWGKENGRL